MCSKTLSKLFAFYERKVILKKTVQENDHLGFDVCLFENVKNRNVMAFSKENWQVLYHLLVTYCCLPNHPKLSDSKQCIIVSHGSWLSWATVNNSEPLSCGWGHTVAGIESPRGSFTSISYTWTAWLAPLGSSVFLQAAPWLAGHPPSMVNSVCQTPCMAAALHQSEGSMTLRPKLQVFQNLASQAPHPCPSSVTLGNADSW